MAALCRDAATATQNEISANAVRSAEQHPTGGRNSPAGHVAIEPQARPYNGCRDCRTGGGTKSRFQRTVTHATRKTATAAGKAMSATPSSGGRLYRGPLNKMYCYTLIQLCPVKFSQLGVPLRKMMGRGRKTSISGFQIFLCWHGDEP